MRCPRCGNENLDSNRFCGMCGGSLLPAASSVSPAADRTPATASLTPISALPSPAASGPVTSTTRLSSAGSPPASANPVSSRSSMGVSDDPPVISGPSFLGLNDPGPRRAARLDNNPHGSPGVGSLDYLLEDEEEPSRGVRAKFVLMLLALALALGFGYLRWKNHGMPWLNASASKPAAAQSSDGTDMNSTPPPASNTASAPTSVPTSSTPSAPPSNVAGAPVPPAATQPTPDSTAISSAPAAGGPATNPATGLAPVSAAPATNAPTSSRDAANSTATPTPVPKDKDKDADSDADAVDPNSPPAASPISNERVAQPAVKPHAALPRVATDNVAEAQKYIYGRGVTQDCERGMRLLKPAANQSNPKAMIEMGALYSAGLCTPHDLPTAYRWFALALRKDPDNQAVQTDLQKLWGEMTQPERQLAIKLSQ